ncbi:MAG: aminopeptidase P family protein [Saprospiraceae bacterium]|nr:aminopeptidase P family protein [Saprospiraceae bacterium]
MRYSAIHPSTFQQNRLRFAREMRPDSLAIFQSNDAMPRNGDQFYRYRQNSDFFYLSGIDQAQSVLVLFPNCPNEDLREVLFVNKADEKMVTWEGPTYSKEDCRHISGVRKVLWLSDIEGVLQQMIYQTKRIYINGNENDRFSTEIKSRDQRYYELLLEKYPFHKYHRAQPILRRLRMIKSGGEIEVMHKACQIAAKAFHKVLQNIEPGQPEYAVEGDIISTFIKEGASGHAYAPIVASGASACVLHYIDNDKICSDGDMLLLDFGCEYGYYASDLTRSIPVNGQYSSRQRRVYEAVLSVFKEMREMMVPGTTFEELNHAASKLISHALVDLDLMGSEQVPDDFTKPNLPHRRYFMHGICHHIGMDVHDLSDRNIPLQSGMVLTCEPGIYIREEDIGIRIENNILVTDDGPVDLMKEIPIECDEIESLMHERAVL